MNTQSTIPQKGKQLTGAGEFANIFEVQQLHIPGREMGTEESYRVKPGMQSSEKWVIKNGTRIICHFNTQFEVVVI